MPEQFRSRTTSRMPALALSGFFFFLLAEVALLVFVSTQLGWWTLAALVLSTVLGVYLLQREWRKAWKQLSESLRAGSLPTGGTADAALVLLGGILLILPGFITDVVGLLLLLPLTRPAVRSGLGWWVGRLVSGHTQSPSNPASRSTVIEGEVVSEDNDSSVEGRIILPDHPHDKEDDST